MTPHDYPRTERVCPLDVDWQPSLREQAQYRREARGTGRVVTVMMGLVWCLVLGFIAAQHYCSSPADAADIQGGASDTSRVRTGELPPTAHPRVHSHGGGQ